MPDVLATPAQDDLVVVDKFTGEEIAVLPQLTAEQALDALDIAQTATATAAALSRHRRAAILDGAAMLLRERSESVSQLIVSEAGKTIRQARKEVSRAVNTLLLSAAEARRNAGEVIPFDSFPGDENRLGWYSREPLGLIVAITPYNDALNLVAHKLGPALAGGNAVLLKPSQQTPLTAQLLVDLLYESGLPDNVITVVRGNRQVAQALVRARNVRMVSFTGGFATGQAIAASAGIKKLAMELGGNAPVLVFEDADLELAVKAAVSGSFWAAGQNCIGAQRILVQRSVFPAFLKAFVAATERLVSGNPRLDATDVGPMISAQAAETARTKIQEAVADGATLLTGGVRNGSVLTPAVLTGVPRTCRLWHEEVFAPIVVVEPFDDERSAILAANDSDYALQAGVFTSDLDRALRVAESIDAGGVMINDSSDYRLDSMPFGGSKYGSMGREGVRFAYEEMTQPKVVAISRSSARG
ncbi:aldehyde dehydrogenase family protein [Microbacterium esteraromaticum]|uniref:Aldehyde dehydrogenase family protein n=1 Tax=Microbacterium esteraromaticum TaxID=57043 RepID=A0A7D8AL49_9MICO|nr:aldehyde dehydrogenase family protein [Microbacterium esteraromaticum]QMU97167.1 aldehyde dehydrogenase family protein [Microbacterium esteraromaticum]